MRKFIFFWLIIFGYFPIQRAQVVDTLEIGINGEGTKIILPGDSVFSKEITFEDSGRIYTIRISGKSKNLPNTVHPTPNISHQKTQKSLFSQTGIGLVLPIGNNRFLNGYNSMLANTADSNGLNSIHNNKFDPGVGMALNIFQKVKFWRNGWRLNKSIWVNYYNFGMQFSVVGTTALSDAYGRPYYSRVENVNGINYFTTAAKYRYHKLGIFFPLLIEKRYELNNAKTISFQGGLAIGINLLNRNFVNAPIFIYNDNFNALGGVLNCISGLMGVQVHRVGMMLKANYNPPSNTNTFYNPQNILLQFMGTYKLY